MTFFRHEFIDAADVPSRPDLVSRLHRGDLDGLIVAHVYSDAECAAVRRDLEDGRHELQRTEFPAKFKSSFFGTNLNLAHPDLADYFADAARFRVGLTKIFPGDLDLEKRVTSVLSALDGGRPYVAPPGPETGQRYMFTTLRHHPAGGYIPPHFDDEQAARPSYRFLRPLIERKLISFVLAFSQADAGGELEVFDRAPDDDGRPIVAGERNAVRGEPGNVETFRHSLAPGEMIIFRSGRFLHRLTPVIGPRARWNACSFMAASRDGERVYCWG